MDRCWKSRYFYLAGGIFCLIALAGFFLGPGGEKEFSSPRDVLDKSQYLFSEAKDFGRIVDFNIIQNSVLAPAAPAFLVSGNILGALGGSFGRREIEEYIVEQGDTLSSIAVEFDISLETLLWANDLTVNSFLQPGQKIIILPVSGILHIIRGGDTLSQIAEIYQAKVADIIEFNGLEDEGKIFIGDILIIPGGKKPKVAQIYVQVPLPQTYFICPIPSPCRITQGLHWYNAVDFSNGKCGEPVFAAAGGTVQRTGFGSVSGYYVRLLHPNGIVTFYGHLAKIAVNSGQKVYQGQIIGYVGSSGLTVPRGPAGCHLHFDVRFAKNPFAGFSPGTELGK